MRSKSQLCALGVMLPMLMVSTVRAEPSDAFTAAAEHYRSGRWQQACDSFARLLATEPEYAQRADAQFFYGEALVQLGRWKEARPHFAKVLEIEPDGTRSRRSMFRMGEAAYMAGDDAAAQRELAAFTDRFPDDPLNAYSLAYLGGLALQVEDGTGAEQRFRESLKRYPDGPMAAEAQFGLAQALHQSGRLNQAEVEYQRVANTDGALAEPALLQVGSIQNVLGDHAAALNSFEAFEKRYPKSSLREKVELGRGYALLKLDRPQEAEQAFAQLSGSPALHVESAYYLALAKGAEGKWSEAAQALSSIKLTPEHVLAPAVAFHKADALSHTQQVEAAREAFDQLLKEFPSSAWADDAELGKLRLAVQAKDPAESLRLAEEMLKKFPDSELASQALLAKGQAQALLDKHGEAVETLQGLLADNSATKEQIDELRARAQGIVAVSKAKLGEFDGAKEAIASLPKDEQLAAVVNETKLRVGELAQSAGQEPLAQELLAGVATGSAKMADRARTSLAWNHFEAGRWAEAADAFKAVLQTDPTGPQAAEATLLEGRALEHLNQTSDALALYQQVVQKFPQSTRAPEAQLCLARLYEQLGRNADAEQAYTTLVKAYPEFPGIDEALYRGGWLAREANPELSKQLFEQLRNEHANSSYVPDATLQLASSAIDRRDYPAAEALLRDVTRPDAPAEVRPQALYLEGRLHMVRNEWADAQKPLQQLITEHPDSELALSAEYLLGEATFHTGDFEQANERLTALVTKAAGRNDAWLPTAELRRAEALASLRRWNEAAMIAQSIENKYPNFHETYEADYLIGRAFVAQANFDAARQWYAKSLASPNAAGTETAAMAQWMIGESYFHQQQYPQALAEYLKVDDTYPRWHEAALLQAGKVEEVQGNWQAATDYYKNLVERYPTGQLVAEANRRLEALKVRASSTPTARK